MATKSGTAETLSSRSALLFVAAFAFTIFIIFLNKYYWIVSTLAYFSMVAGILLRKKRQSHVTFMGLAVFLDLVIVLTLQTRKDAIGTALSFSLDTVQQLHILASTIALILYFPVVAVGFLRWTGRLSSQKSQIFHKRLGIVAFVFRTLGFFLMFSMVID